jgi:hypothetical protein
MVDAMKYKAGDLHRTMETMNEIHKRVKNELQIIPSMGKELDDQKKNLGDLLTLLAPYDDGRGKAKLAGSGMIGRYTMEKERQIHRKSVSGAHETINPINPVANQGLGDNVELF